MVIIDDILDFSKLEAHKMSLKIEPVDLSQLMNDIYTVFALQMQESSVKLMCNIDPNLPKLTMVDSMRIRQILYNLISNAIKFTEEGEIVISLECLSDNTNTSKDCQRLRFKVVDSGIGIDVEMRSRVFSEFEQFGTLHTTKGTGLGLAICKRLIELMEGELSFQSSLGDGSSFWFELPVTFAEAVPSHFEQSTEVKQEATVELTKEGPKELSNTPVSSIDMKILVAEDNFINQLVIQGLLESLGCKVVLIDDGRAAIEEVKTQSFDLILMDCDMPDIDGFEATRVIRQRELQQSSLPITIIALTAHVLESAKQECFDAGMDDYLAKPIDVKALREKLLQWQGCQPNVELADSTC